MMDRERAAHVAWTPAVVRLMAGLMLSMFVAAMDSTVVGTALPTIAKELGQFSLYPWVFSGYLITATTSVPLWGRLADSKGRKSVLLAGMAIFVIASVLCAASPGMGWLIAFRTAQGIGAGCVQPLVFTILSDVFPLAQRARLTGFFSAMWAIAAIIGPALGALFVSTVGWRWIFLINLPAGVISTALVLGYRERRPATAAGGIDLRSGLLLTAGIALLLWGLGSGSASATPNWPIVGLALLILAAFGVLGDGARGLPAAGDGRRRRARAGDGDAGHRPARRRVGHALGRGGLAGHGRRHGAHLGAAADRDPEQRPLGAAGRGHGHEPVRAHHRGRDRHLPDGGSGPGLCARRGRSPDRPGPAGGRAARPLRQPAGAGSRGLREWIGDPGQRV